MTVTEIITIVLGSAGLLFMAISILGIYLFPDFFTRLHAQGIGDTLGALLIIIAMMVATGLKLISIKIFLLFIVIMLTNPMGTNLMMIAAIHNKDYQKYSEKDPEQSSGPGEETEEEK